MRSGHRLHVPGSESVPIETETAGSPIQEPELAELEGLMEEAIDYHEKALSENTCKAYQRGWEDFAEFCEERGFPLMPSTEQAVVLFLTGRARRLSPSMLYQRLSAIQASPQFNTSTTNGMRKARSGRRPCAT